jgi:hypothetical protein
VNERDGLSWLAKPTALIPRSLSFAIDGLAAAIFMDALPSRLRSAKQMQGTPDDDFSAMWESPARREFESFRADLRCICGRSKAWLTPP